MGIMDEVNQEKEIIDVDEEFANNFASLIKKYREQRGYSLQLLSSMSKVSAPYINRIERNERKNIGFGKVLRLAACLGITYSELINCAYSESEDDENESEALNLLDVINENGVRLNEVELSVEGKAVLIDVITFIIEAKWNMDTKVHDLYVLSEKINKLKNKL